MASPGLGIIAGSGILPRLVAEHCALVARPYRVVTFAGMPLDWSAGHAGIRAEFERPGELFAGLRKAACADVCFAGAMVRPRLNPARLDPDGLKLAATLTGAMKSGDDATLRVIAGLFEAEGFRIVAAHDVIDGLLVQAGVLTKLQPGDADRADAGRAARIVQALGAVDVGQSAIVAQGICLGVESVQGTDALLEFSGLSAGRFRPDPGGGMGVLYKAPKPGQDWRIDLPAIGTGTVEAAARAGLAGIVVQARGVLLLDGAAAIAAADRLGLFLWGREA